MPSDKGGRGGGGEGDKATVNFHLALDEDNGVRKRVSRYGVGVSLMTSLKFYVFSLASFRLQL